LAPIHTRLVISGRSRVNEAAWPRKSSWSMLRVPISRAMQAQPDLLLGDLGVALHRSLLTLQFLIAQVPEGRDDRREEEQHRHQRAQRGVAVLAGRRLAAPPAPEQALRPAFRGFRGGRDVVDGLHLRIIGGRAFRAGHRPLRPLC